jgi:hypothetical protein
MIEPVRLSFVVHCRADHAFATWTSKATSWWPPDHTMSHDPGAEIVFEPQVGGRIFERTPAGQEIEWGQVTAWDPPRRLAYLWHIATDLAHATDVEVWFRQLPDRSTRVEIEHGGWDRLGPVGEPWREMNQGGWDGVLPAYVTALGM